MSIPLTYFLYAYYVFLAIWVVFFLVGLYHMLKFGFKNVVTLLSTIIITSVAVAMFLASFYFIATIDYWDQPAFNLPELNNSNVGF